MRENWVGGATLILRWVCAWQAPILSARASSRPNPVAIRLRVRLASRKESLARFHGVYTMAPRLFHFHCLKRRYYIVTEVKARLDMRTCIIDLLRIFTFASRFEVGLEGTNDISWKRWCL